MPGANEACAGCAAQRAWAPIWAIFGFRYAAQPGGFVRVATLAPSATSLKPHPHTAIKFFARHHLIASLATHWRAPPFICTLGLATPAVLRADAFVVVIPNEEIDDALL